MDAPEFKGPDAHTILEALTQVGLKRTHPREVIAAYVAQKGEANADFTIEDLWREVRTTHADFRAGDGRSARSSSWSGLGLWIASRFPMERSSIMWEKVPAGNT